MAMNKKNGLKVWLRASLAGVARVRLGTWFYWPVEPATSVPQLPAAFELNERVFNVGHTFDVQSGDTTYGKVEEKWFRFTKTLFYTDNDGKLVAYARKAFISFGTRIDVFDGNGVYIGSLQKQVFSSLLKVTTTYSVLDAKGYEIASCQKTSIITTDMQLQDIAGNHVAELYRPLSLVGDSWLLKVHKAGAIDSRLLVMIGPFKTMADSK